MVDLTVVNGLGHPDVQVIWVTFRPDQVGLIHFIEYLGVTWMRLRVT